MKNIESSHCLCFLLFILVTHPYKSEPFLTGKQIGGEKPEVTEEVKPAPGQMPNNVPQPMTGLPVSAPGPFPPGLPPGEIFI